MKCPNCNYNNPEGNKFCAECGTKLEVDFSVIECPKCHSRIPADSKFCPDCGKEITDQNNGVFNREKYGAEIHRIYKSHDSYSNLDSIIKDQQLLDTFKKQIDFEITRLENKKKENKEKQHKRWLVMDSLPDGKLKDVSRRNYYDYCDLIAKEENKILSATLELNCMKQEVMMFQKNMEVLANRFR